MTNDELRALLGEFYDDTTDEQRDAIVQAAAAIAERWDDPDLDDTRREALNGAMMVVLGDDTLEDIASRWHAARAAERDARAVLTGALIASYGRAVQVRDGRGGGVVYTGSETELALRARVTRMTVRKALGKSKGGRA